MGAGTRIKHYLEINGISQSHLSRRTGIALAKLNLSLNEKRTLKLDEYKSICYALGVSADTFLEPKPPDKFRDA